MARNAARRKLGYYPLVENEAKRIRQFLQFPDTYAALDPCAGTGRALDLIAGNTGARPYGIELDAFRAADAGKILHHVVQGSTFDAHSPVESYSLLYLNPPYDDEVHDDRSRRSEAVFLEHCFRWLMPKGVLVLVIPAQRVSACSTIISSHFRDVAMYRLTDPEAARYKQSRAVRYPAQPLRTRAPESRLSTRSSTTPGPEEETWSQRAAKADRRDQKLVRICAQFVQTASGESRSQR